MKNSVLTLDQIRESFRKASDAEKRLWQLLCKSEPCQSYKNGPVDALILKILRERRELNFEPVLMGICPFYIRKVNPLSELAKNAGIFSLLGALSWSSSSKLIDSIPSTTDSVWLQFCREYLDFLILVSKQSPEIASVCAGVDLETARKIEKININELTIEIFLRHFEVEFGFIGSDYGQYGDCRDPVQMALIDSIDVIGSGGRNYRKLFLMKVFQPKKVKYSDRKIVLNKEDEFNSFIPLCRESRVSPPALKRFFKYLGYEERTALNLSRRLLRNVERAKKPGVLPIKEKLWLLNRVCQAVTIRSLGTSYSPNDLVNVFCLACLVAVRTLSPKDYEGFEGFWFSWLEKKNQSFLMTLASDKPFTYCGENSELSAKNNLLGETHA